MIYLGASAKEKLNNYAKKRELDWIISYVFRLQVGVVAD